VICPSSVVTGFGSVACSTETVQPAIACACTPSIGLLVGKSISTVVVLAPVVLSFGTAKPKITSLDPFGIEPGCSVTCAHAAVAGTSTASATMTAAGRMRRVGMASSLRDRTTRKSRRNARKGSMSSYGRVPLDHGSGSKR
jgi:hypothetical protein